MRRQKAAAPYAHRYVAKSLWKPAQKMSKLAEAIQTVKSGNKAKGQSLLAQFLKNDPQNEVAWLWMAVAIEDPQRKRQCLQRVLQINPHNLTAQHGLLQLEKRGAIHEIPTVEQLTSMTAGQALTPKPRSLSGSPSSENVAVENASRASEIFRLYLVSSQKFGVGSGRISQG